MSQDIILVPALSLLCKAKLYCNALFADQSLIILHYQELDLAVKKMTFFFFKQSFTVGINHYDAYGRHDLKLHHVPEVPNAPGLMSMGLDLTLR